jgi:hypothetical protein
MRDLHGVTAAAFGPFLAGLVIGVAIGFVLGPLVRDWLVWRVRVEVSREDDLTDRMQKQLLEELDHPLEMSLEEADEPLPDHRWSSGPGRTRNEPGEPSPRSGMRRRRLGAEKPRT